MVVLLALLQLGQDPDASRVLDQARAAQARFERTRRASLPITPTGGGRCDERVGRFCYWYDPGEPPPPPEPPRIAAARAELLATLDDLAALAPADPWIAGQRVRYLVEHGHPAQALVVVSACRSVPWWCDALAGFVHHAMGEYGAADRAYARMMERMPEETRCRWNDLDPLLESGAAEGYGRLGCAQRDSANATLFWLGRPRAGEPGNDLRTEILARRTYAAIMDGATTHHGSRFTDDLAELILRYGWATAWSRRPPSTTAPGEVSVVGHEPHPAYAFLPVAVERNGAGETARAVRYALEAPRVRSRYAPRWASTVTGVRDLMVSGFERGDGTLLVAAFDARTDTLFGGDDVEAVLGLSPLPGEAPVTRRVVAPAGRGAAQVRSRGVGGLLVLEVIDPTSGAVALERRVIPGARAAGPRLSDLLLFEPGGTLPVTAEEAGEAAMASGETPPHRRVGVYWEVYGIPDRPEPPLISVRVLERGPGFLGRLGRALGLGGEAAPVELSWPGRTGQAGMSGEAVELDLSRLDPGRYRLVVAVEFAGGERVAAERELSLPRLR